MKREKKCSRQDAIFHSYCRSLPTRLAPYLRERSIQSTFGVEINNKHNEKINIERRPFIT